MRMCVLTGCRADSQGAPSTEISSGHQISRAGALSRHNVGNTELAVHAGLGQYEVHRGMLYASTRQLADLPARVPRSRDALASAAPAAWARSHHDSTQTRLVDRS